MNSKVLVLIMVAFTFDLVWGNVYYFPESCNKRIIVSKKDRCWMDFNCGDNLSRVFIVFHCGKEKKLYMTAKKGPKYTALKSLAVFEKGIGFTTVADKLPNSDIKSVAVFVPKKTMQEEVLQKSKDGILHFISADNGDISLHLLTIGECSKKTFKVDGIDGCVLTKKDLPFKIE